MKRTSLLDNGLIWFGAGVSIAEILTGTYFASLGFSKGMMAILAGHIIGGIMFFLAALMGGMTRKSSMETTKMSFGRNGGIVFAVLNVIQLVGWTAIMIYDGALSAQSVVSSPRWIWCLVIGGLIIVWIRIGIEDLGKVNTAAMILLFVLSIVLCVIIFRAGTPAASADDSLSFGAAVELAVSMPLSWLPVVADYTREAEKPFEASLVSTVVYSIVSTWMFVIGMGAAIFAGTSDIALIMVRAGLGIAGLLIIVFSTVTTTFLDAFSAGISFESVSLKAQGKRAAVIATIIGTAAAVVYPMDDITNFLYFIGSVFAPMIAVMIADYYILHRDFSEQSVQWQNLIVWVLGFMFYRWMMNLSFPLGSTLPDMAATILLAVIVAKLTGKKSI